MIKNPIDEKCGETVRFVANACECPERVSGFLLKRDPLPGSNEVGGHDRGKNYLLSTSYRSTLWYLALYTVAAVVSCAI